MCAGLSLSVTVVRFLYGEAAQTGVWRVSEEASDPALTAADLRWND